MTVLYIKGSILHINEISSLGFLIANEIITRNDFIQIKGDIMISNIKYFAKLSFGCFIMAIGVHFFKFPNAFNFGGVSGLAVLVSSTELITASAFNLIANFILLIIGCFFLGRTFITTTAYCSTLLSLLIYGFDYFYPLNTPLTNDPMLELFFAISLPAVGAAIIFNLDSSSGGMDIVAMILKKFTSINIGSALMISNIFITAGSFIFFDIKTALYSLVGLAISSLLIDNVIESINLCKYFNVVCNDPKPICDFITKELKRSATFVEGTGAFTGKNKYIIFTVMNRVQALKLRNFIKLQEPTAFILISNTSEIVGKGFHKG